MVCLTNEQSFDDFTMEPFTDQDWSELNDLLDDDEQTTIQPINLENVFAEEDNSETSDSDSDDSELAEMWDSDSDDSEFEGQILECRYFPTLTIPQLENLAASAYHDRNPAQLSEVLDPIARQWNVASDSIKNELISFHEDMDNGLWVHQIQFLKQIKNK